MICCAMGVAAVATGAIGWRRFRRFFGRRPATRSTLTAVVVAVVMVTAAGVVEHFGHHAVYGNGESLLTDLGPLPLCRGGSDRTTSIASIEE